MSLQRVVARLFASRPEPSTEDHARVTRGSQRLTRPHPRRSMAARCATRVHDTRGGRSVTRMRGRPSAVGETPLPGGETARETRWLASRQAEITHAEGAMTDPDGATTGGEGSEGTHATEQPTDSRPGHTRRAFLGAGAVALLGLAAPRS